MIKKISTPIRVCEFVIQMIAIITMAFAPSSAYALDPSTSIDKYVIHTWTTRDGLPQNTIQSITQDKNGYLWLGTQQGLTRFDGSQFLTFNTSNTPGIKNNAISSLLMTKDKTLRIGTQGGGLTQLKNRKFENISFNNQPTLPINTLAEDSHGNLWIGTTGDGLIKYDGKTFRNYSTNLSNKVVNSILPDSQNNLWIGTENGLNYLPGTTTNPQTTTINYFTGIHINTLFQDSRGNLWIGTTTGIIKIKNPRQWITSPTPIPTNLSHLNTRNGLPGNIVQSIIEDRNQNIWIATNGGLSRIKNPSKGNPFPPIENITEKDGLTDNTILSLYEDKWGNLWVGTAGGGLNMLRQGKFSFYTQKDGLSIPYIQCILQDHLDNLWIGTHGGGLQHFKNNKFTTYTQTDGLTSNDIQSLAADTEGNLWIGTSNGLNQFTNGKFQPITTQNHPSENNIKTLYIDSEQYLWIGTHGGGLNCYNPRTREFDYYTIKNGLADNFITTLNQDKYHNLWIGTQKGIQCLDHGFFRQYTNTPKSIILDIYCDTQGATWISTRNEGIIRYKNGTYSTLKSNLPFGNTPIFRILEAPDGTLWMTSSTGIYSTPKRKLNTYFDNQPPTTTTPENLIHLIRWKHYRENDGLKTSVCSGGSQPAGWLTTNAQLWFPTIQGIAVMDLNKPTFTVQREDIPTLPEEEIQGKISYLALIKEQSVIIEKVISDQKEYIPRMPRNNIELPTHTRKIEIHYTDINFDQSPSIMYKYILENLDNEWKYAENQKTAVYSDLPPGQYKFRIRARTGESDWSPENPPLIIYIPYPFYKTIPFFAIIITLITFLIWAVPRYLERKASRKEKDDEKYRTSSLTPQKSKQHLNRLIKIMTQEKPYLDPELSLQQLAQRLEITKEDLSQVINEQLHKNFKNFINDYRIEEAKRKLVDPKENQFVLLKIAFDVGFNSKSAFNATFKKATGLSPSDYRKQNQDKT